MNDHLDVPLRRFKLKIFQALANPTRIAIVELLEDNVSQHLAILSAKQIVTNRKSGNQVFYSIRDPIIPSVLQLMRTYS